MCVDSAWGFWASFCFGFLHKYHFDWSMNWLTDWLMLIDWCCFRRTHYLPFATTWTRLSRWCEHFSLMWPGPVLTPNRRSRWSIETDFSLQVKQVVYWNRLFFASQAGGLLKQTFLCKSSRWSFETDFSLASHTGCLLKQTFLLHIKQVVSWNRLFSFK